MKKGVQGPLAVSGNTPAPAIHYEPPPDTGLDIIFEDPGFLVLSKPAGLLSVAGKSPDLQDCMESRVKLRFPTALTVHRLDRATSGILVMALNREAHKSLSAQFEKRQTQKTYIAVVAGNVVSDEGHVDLPLRTDWYNRPKQMVDRCLGREALTYWRVLDRGDDSTRIELRPVTGRSHQLRVHMQWLGHPIIGDEFYSSSRSCRNVHRLMLHASSLGLFHPTKSSRISFEDPCPF